MADEIDTTNDRIEGVMKIKKIIGWVLATMPIWLTFILVAYKHGGVHGLTVMAGIFLLIALWVYGVKIVVVDD